VRGEGEGWNVLVMTVWNKRIHGSGVQNKWYLSSDHWELLNVLQSTGEQVLELGLDVSVFFELSLNDLEGVCGHVRPYDHMCEFRHNITDTRANMVARTEHS
jgi:hypothetical protein